MLKASEAQEAISKKNRIRKETFRQILESFMRKIRLTIEQGRTQTVLEVPEFVPGLPLYDRTQATKYLTRQLELLGYAAQQVSEWTMHVDWGRPKPPVGGSKEVRVGTSYQHLANEIRRKKGAPQRN
jgi:hypothetical protein